MKALLQASTQPSRHLRRTALAAAAAALGAGLLLVPTASAADNYGPGYPIPPSSGTGTSHLGAYANLQGTTSLGYCADPDLSGPDTSGGYGAPATVTTWTSNITGKTVTSDDFHHAAYVLSRYGQTTVDAQAAAVDAAVNSYLNAGSTYDLRTNGARANQRLSYPDVSPTAKTNTAAYMSAADNYAGPYTAHIDPQSTVENGKATTFDLYVTSASGHKLPQIPITLHATSGKDSATATFSTNASGDYMARVTPDGNADINLTLDANSLPGTSLRTIAPHDPKAQRLLLAGGTSTTETKLTAHNASAGGGTIKVTKTAADTGKPLAGVEFAVNDAAGKTIARGKTDADGTWRTGLLPPGHYTVHEVRAVVGYQIAADQTTTVTAGKTSSLTVTDSRIKTPTTPKPRPVTIHQLPQTGA